jgi:hypothetical protein
MSRSRSEWRWEEGFKRWRLHCDRGRGSTYATELVIRIDGDDGYILTLIDHGAIAALPTLDLAEELGYYVIRRPEDELPEDSLGLWIDSKHRDMRYAVKQSQDALDRAQGQLKSTQDNLADFERMFNLG